jgi:protein-S-isoprenylcysteine O-methyltransferase Ste14
MLEILFVITLFVLYIILWRIKQVSQIRDTGVDPQVMGKSLSNVQVYFSGFTKMMTFYGMVVIILLGVNVQIGSFLSRVRELSSPSIDIAGFVIGLAGLSLCLYAQSKMGASWRVGIDEKIKTTLITTGLYAYIRNPTYLGLFLFNAGIWLIFPTWAIFILNLLFVIFLEVQVRCEEDYLTTYHGEEYITYRQHTKRYIPYIY